MRFFKQEKRREVVIPDIATYIIQYLRNKPIDIDWEIWVGCDSQKSYSNLASYTTAICFYKLFNGAHVVYRTDKREIIKVARTKGKDKEAKNNRKGQILDRLWKEVEISAELGEYLIKTGVLIRNGAPYYFFPNGNRKIPFIIDVDFSILDECDSSLLYKAAGGYLTEKGFQWRLKPTSYAASYAADHIVRGKLRKNEKNSPPYSKRRRYKK